MTPVRLQLSRAKGFNLQAGSLAVNGLPAVKVDRSTKWGNPFIVGENGKREECLYLYKMLLSGHICLTSARRRTKQDTIDHVEAQKAAYRHVSRYLWRLTNKNLACWCPLDKPCHADVLLELANR